MRKTLSLFVLAFACFAQADYTLTVLHTNDLHAHIEPTKIGNKTYGGYAKQMTLIKKYRAEDPNVILLNGGDTFQGTLFFTQYTGLADLSIMNVMGYDAMAVGNHEFDLGPDPLVDFAKYATFPLLSANLDVSGVEGLKDRIKPHTIKVVGGQKIGMIGAMTPDLPAISSPGPNVKLLNLFDSINKSIAALKSEGVSKIVLLSHLGTGLERDAAKQCPGLDVIIGGHSHTYLGKPGVEGFPQPGGPYPTVVENSESKVLLVSAWEWGKVFGRIKVNFDDAGKVKDWADAEPILVEESIPDDLTVASIIAAFVKPIDSLRKTVVANAPFELSRANSGRGNSVVGNVIADAMLAASEKAGAKLAIMNNGGIRAEIDQGPITFDEVIQTSPFSNTLVVMDLTGAELLSVFEHAARSNGVSIHISKWTKVKIDGSKPAGQRVVSVTINGETVEKSKTYRIVTNSFVAGAGDAFTMLKDAKGYRLDTGTLDRDALVEYLKNFKGDDPTREPRFEFVRG